MVIDWNKQSPSPFIFIKTSLLIIDGQNYFYIWKVLSDAPTYNAESVSEFPLFPKRNIKSDTLSNKRVYSHSATTADMQVKPCYLKLEYEKLIYSRPKVALPSAASSITLGRE